MNKKIKGENNDEDYEIVFSDDPNFVKKKDIKPSEEIIPNLIKINIRIEKKTTWWKDCYSIVWFSS